MFLASPSLERRPQWRPRVQTCSPQRATLYSDGSKSLLRALKLSGSYVRSGPHGRREAQGRALMFNVGTEGTDLDTAAEDQGC